MEQQNSSNMNGRGNRKVQYLIAISLSLASLTLGVSSTWPTLVIPKFQNNLTDVEITKDQISWMLAMTPPGFIAGSMATRFVSDRFGRRTTVLASMLPFIVGTIIVTCAMKAWLLYVTRFLWGCGTGMIATVNAVYLAEISDKDLRGRLSVGTKLMFNFGNLLMMSTGTFIAYNTLNCILLGFPICCFLACWWIPESPYFYLKEGKVDAARKQLIILRKYKDEKTLEDELLQMQSDVRSEMRRSSSIKELIIGKQYRKAIIIVTGLKVTQIMTGVVTTQNYLGTIMQESNTTMSLSTSYIVFGAVTFIVGIMSSILVERVGRRPLLVYSFFGTSFSLAIVSIYFFLKDVIHIDHDKLHPYGFLPFVGIIFSNMISTLGFNSIAVVIPAEIFPLNVKSIAMTCLSVFGGVLGFIVAIGFQKVKDVSGLSGVFLVFASFSFAGAVFALLVVPETKGKTLKEILVLLQGNFYDEANVVINKKKDTNEDIDGSREMKVFTRKDNNSV